MINKSSSAENPTLNNGEFGKGWRYWGAFGGVALTTVAGVASFANRANAQTDAAHGEASANLIDTSPGKNPNMSQAQVYAEQGQALESLKKEWEGVLLLHAPTKAISSTAAIGFFESPSATYPYDVYGVSNKDAFGRKNDRDNLIAVRYGIERFKGRVYAVIFDPKTNRWGFMDVKEAVAVGAVDFYANKKPEPLADQKVLNQKAVAYNGAQPPKDLMKSTNAKEAARFLKLAGFVKSSVVPHP